MIGRIFKTNRKNHVRGTLQHPRWIPWLAAFGGVVTITGTFVTWFSLFAGLQPYRGVNVLNGRVLMAGGVLSVIAGASYLLSGRLWLRWGIGFLGFVLLAFTSWSLFQLLVLYRELSRDAMMLAKLGPGHFVVLAGALLVFATFFVDDGLNNPSAQTQEQSPSLELTRLERFLISLSFERYKPCRTTEKKKGMSSLQQ